MSGREPVEQKPLNRRFGYSAEDARQYSAGEALEESWIRIASAATMTKLVFFYSSWLVLLALFVLALGRAFRST